MNQPDRGTQILVVEDEAIVSLDIKKMLVEAGYEVAHVAASGEDALRSLELSVPDLILMDIHIKGNADGVETAAQIRQKFQVPIVFVTAHADSATIERAKSSQPFGYVVKPISKLTLTSTIEMALHKSSVEKRLHEHRAWMATILGGIPDSVIVTDINGKVEFVNPAAERLLGQRQSAFVLRDVQAILPLRTAMISDLTSEAFKDALVNGKFELPRETVLCLQGTAEKIPIEGQVAISYVGHQMAGTIFTLRDASIREQEDLQIRQEQKMKAVSEFASEISQSFYGLFDTILRANSQLKRFVESSPMSRDGKIVQEAESVQQASKMGKLMSSQLAKLADPYSLRPQSVNVNDLISYARPALEKLRGEAINLEFDLCAEPTFVFCGPNHLEQMLLDAFVSCREILGAAGSVRLVTQIARDQRDHVKIGFQLASERALNLPSSDSASDLDLPVASAIASAAEGTVRLKRHSETKAEVEITLPRQRPSIETEPKFAEARGVVLIVGTEAGLTRTIERQLEADQYVMIDSSNVAEALFVARFYDGEILAVIADVDGVSANNRQRIKRAFLDRNQGTKFICLSGQPDSSDPAWHCVLKPSQTRNIANILVSLLQPDDLTTRAAHNC